MKYLKVLLVAIIFYNCSEKEALGTSVLHYVDPFISTEGDHGHWHPSALSPFGMVKLGPDTHPSSLTGDGDWAHSGYNYADTSVRGFSHLRTGSSGGGHIYDRAGLVSLMPFSSVKDSSWLVSPIEVINKKTEQASPGFYSVLLTNDSIRVELTTTPYVGFHKYSFKGNSPAKILFSAGKIDLNQIIAFKQIDATTLEGELDVRGGVYFVAKFSHPLTKVKKISNEVVALESQSTGAIICSFGNLNTPLMVKVGFSFTGVEGARKNLEATCKGWDFKEVKDEVAYSWEKQLSSINVKGENNRDKRIFYTALYRTCFLPIVQSDFDGTYKGFDLELHRTKGYKYYNGFAFWDSFRTKYPLYSLYAPEVYSDIVSSIYDTYKQADNWDPFPNSDHKPHNSPLFRANGKNGYGNFSTVRHEHMLMVMTDAYFKGLYHEALDIKKVYPHLKKEALLQMPETYDAIGFIPRRPDQTGEYSWDNWCLAKLAKHLGEDQDVTYFNKRSNYWKNTWDYEIKFFRAKDEYGNWLDFPNDPRENREKYTYEGTKWQWRWNALHDVDGMVEAMGGKNTFIDSLNYFFENNLYTAGNQIDLHAPLLFNRAGAPWLTQKWMNRLLTKPNTQLYGTHGYFETPIIDHIYKDTSDGFLEEMDGDFGCMSAWYNLGAIGLYQICPGDTKYQISTPVFEEISMKVSGKSAQVKKFRVVTKNFTEENIYIQSAKLNGEVINRSWLDYSEIAKGGILELVLGAIPNKTWGIN